MARRVIFGASNGTSDAIWFTDGSSAGVLQAFQVGSVAVPAPFGTVAGQVLFEASGPATGYEPWITDGTFSGTVLLKDLAPGSASSFVGRSAEIGPATTVFTENGISQPSHLFVTNGTTGGTGLVRDFNSIVTIRNNVSGGVGAPTKLFEGKAVFLGSDANGREPWVTDGTAAGTTMLRNIAPGAGDSSPSDFTALGFGKSVFAADDLGPTGRELWITDGTAAGTTFVKDLNAGPSGSSPTGFLALGDGRAVFAATDGATGTELWVTNGAAGGTVLLKDIAPGSASSSPLGLTALGGNLFVFSADDGVRGRELWRTDGTAQGTTLVADLDPASGSNPTGFTALGNGTALFSASVAGSGTELWITNGTAAGTRLVADINPGAAGSAPTNFISVGDGRAVFSADDGVNGRDLWVTDGGSLTGLFDINPGASGASLTGFVALGSAHVSDVFRFFDSRDGGHFFTTSVAERAQVLATRPDLVGEGVGYRGFQDGAVAGTGAVYRFFDQNDGGHFFTISSNERDQVLATRPDLKFEGIGFYEFGSDQGGGKSDAVFRFFDQRDGGHFFTSSVAERDQVLATRPDLKFEGIAFYAPHLGVDFSV